MNVQLEIVPFEKPDDVNIILGQSHFIKTAEDIYEALIASMPRLQFGVAFCEASSKCLVRVEGNSDELKKIAAENALRIGCGHSFIVVLREAFPINVLNQLKNVPEICQILCATANPLQVIVAQTAAGRGLVGVIDGSAPKGIETAQDVLERKQLLRKFGYKL